MESRTVLKNAAGLKLLVRLVQFLPPRAAYPLIQVLAWLNLTLRRKHPRVRAMFANQWVLHQGQIGPKELKELVRKTFANRLRAQYDFYHHLNNPQKLMEMVVFSPKIQELIDLAQTSDRGVMLVGLHLGNFDLLGWALAQQIPDMQVISVANPSTSYRVENEVRRRIGLDITPASFEALVKASRRLKSGGLVVTANDRPFEDFKNTLNFCGKPAHLPTVHIRLALKAQVPMVVVAAFRQADKYYLEASDPIRPVPDENHDHEIIFNAERVLEITADFIRKAPDQWNMYYPIWPDAVTKIL